MSVSLEGVDPRLVAFKTRNGLKVTSALGGKHNRHSKHPLGKAIDFSVRTLMKNRPFPEGYWEHLERDAKQHGLILRDERRRPPHQAVWNGSHGHVEVP